MRIAYQLLEFLATFVNHAPTITASPDGIAALCWECGSKSIDLEVLPDGSVKYVFLNEDDSDQDDERIIKKEDFIQFERIFSQF